MSFRTSNLIICVYLLSAAVILFPVYADGQDYKIVGEQHVLCLDGTCEFSFLVENLHTKEIFIRKPEEIPELIRETFPPGKDFVQGLVPLVFRRLPYNVKEIEFCFNTHAAPKKEMMQQILDEYVNKLKGSENKPNIKLSEKVINTDDYTEVTQLYNDGINTIYCHPDDWTYAQQFRGRIAACAGIRCDYAKGEFYEANVSFTYQCLFNEYMVYDSIAGITVHEFGHIFGYRHIGWVEDHMSYRKPYKRPDLYTNPDSIMWEYSKLKDEMTYGGVYENDVYVTKELLLPKKNCFIDIKYLKPNPEYPNYNAHVIAMTSLKGYKRKPLEFAVYRGKKVKESKLIVKISGLNRDIYKNKGLLDHYEVSEVVFSRVEDYEKLEEAVIRYGKSKKLYGKRYDYALKATIVVTGYQGPKEATPLTAQSTVWFLLEEYTPN